MWIWRLFCRLEGLNPDSGEDIRKAAGMSLANGSRTLAAKLLAAREAYTGVDSELAGNLNKQMLDK